MQVKELIEFLQRVPEDSPVEIEAVNSYGIERWPFLVGIVQSYPAGATEPTPVITIRLNCEWESVTTVPREGGKTGFYVNGREFYELTR